MEGPSQKGVKIGICKTRIATQPYLSGIKHLNRLEQIIGRGVRNYSHFDLPDTKRNTTIYQ